MATYRHLTQNERYMMANLHDNDYAQREIAHLLRRSRSTISREIRRNGNAADYHAGKADAQAQRRRWEATSQTITAAQWAAIEAQLRQDWSPEQVSGWLAREGQRPVSHEWIYQHIYQDQANGGTLHTHLRCRKKRRTRYGTFKKRGPIPNRVPMTERPTIVEDRTRIGDWEGDTIRDPSRQQAIVTLMDRTTRFTLLAKVDRAIAEAVQQAIVRLLGPFTDVVETLTFDNGGEFAEHRTITQQLQMPVYFAHPYAAWERGTNENTNGLVRQYLPKGTAFEDVTDADLERIMHRLNTRPRKCLDYQTPAEVFYANQEEPRVALRT